MIEVFKTNVQYLQQAKWLKDILFEHFPELRINFDLHDCDKILRVEGDNICNEQIITVVRNNGHACAALD